MTACGRMPSTSLLQAAWNWHRAHERVAWLHPRMPVILPPDCEGVWLDADLRDPLAAASCLTPEMGAQLEARAVSPLVSSARNDGPQLLLPLS